MNSKTPNQALQMLRDGNERFVKDRATQPNREVERRLKTSEAQEPFAIILGCADSRVSPEIIFDQGIGDLFVVRVAGNVVGPIELDSVHYSALYLHSSIILVLGHQNCGAVTAVLTQQTKDIETVADLIKPAVQEASLQAGDILENAIKNNVQNTVNQLKESPVLYALIEQQKLVIVGGYYNFHTGQVEILRSSIAKSCYFS